MTFSLVWLPSVLLAEGLKVSEVEGWKSRGRREMGKVAGVMCHHTASSLKHRDKVMPSLDLLVKGRSDLAGPLAQLGLARDGTYFVIAAGAANHAGEGVWQGNRQGNSCFIGIEAENAGVPEDPWPEVQMDAYVRGVAAILRHIGADAIMCCAHREYALPAGRKPDPIFDMAPFRARVKALMSGTGTRRPIIPSRLVVAAGDTTVQRRTLRRGMNGDDVKALQEALKLAGDKVDGQFGPGTEAAVRAYQRGKNDASGIPLVPDGIVGPKTWRLLLAADVT